MGYHHTPIRMAQIQSTDNHKCWQGCRAIGTLIRCFLENGSYSYYPIQQQLYSFSSVQFSSVQFSRSVVSDSLWPHESQHSRPPYPSPTPRVHSDSVHRVSDAIQPSHPLSSPSPPAPNPSQHQIIFQWVNSLHEVAKVLEFQLQHDSFQRNPRADLLQNGQVESPCSPRDSQESSPTPQFKSINSLVLSLLRSPTLTSIHDYWKNHSLD